jgi:hypothetical protein
MIRLLPTMPVPNASAGADAFQRPIPSVAPASRRG